MLDGAQITKQAKAEERRRNRVPSIARSQYEKEIQGYIILGFSDNKIVETIKENWGIHPSRGLIKKLKNQIRTEEWTGDAVARANAIVEKSDNELLAKDFSNEPAVSIARASKIMTDRIQLFKGKPTEIKHSLVFEMVKILNLREE